jgi:hypothetical protein
MVKNTESTPDITAEDSPMDNGGGKTSVAYVGMDGITDVRRISKADWKAIGVTDGKDREWVGEWARNRPAITDDFSEGELAYFESDPDFKVTRG